MKTMSSAKNEQEVLDGGKPVVWDNDIPFVSMSDEKRSKGDERAMKQ